MTNLIFFLIFSFTTPVPTYFGLRWNLELKRKNNRNSSLQIHISVLRGGGAHGGGCLDGVMDDDLEGIEYQLILLH